MTAVEAFDLKFLINGDYSACACVSLDYGNSTRRHRCIQKSSRQTRPLILRISSAQLCLNASELYKRTQKFNLDMSSAARVTSRYFVQTVLSHIVHERAT